MSGSAGPGCCFHRPPSACASSPGPHNSVSLIPAGSSISCFTHSFRLFSPSIFAHDICSTHMVFIFFFKLSQSPRDVISSTFVESADFLETLPVFFSLVSCGPFLPWKFLNPVKFPGYCFGIPNTASYRAVHDGVSRR